MAAKASKSPFLADLNIEEVRIIRRSVLDQSGERPRLRQPDRDQSAGRNAEPRGRRKAWAMRRDD
jgi:hypothetical protein